MKQPQGRQEGGGGRRSQRGGGVILERVEQSGREGEE